MRHESLTTGQTNTLLAAIRNLPDDLPSDNVGLLARLTGGDPEGETAPVTTDPAPDAEPTPDPPVERGPLVFEIPMGHFPLSMSIWSYEKMDSSGLEYGGDEISYGVTMNFPEGWRENEPWPSRVPANPEAIDEVESIVEAALETLPNVANAEVTIIVEGYRSHRPTPFDPDHDVILDLWRIELTEGPGGIVSIRPSSTALLYTINGKPGIRIYFPMEQGAALLTGGDTEAVTTDPDPEPEPAPAPDPLVFEIPPGNHTYMWFEVINDLDTGSYQPPIYIHFDSVRSYFNDWYNGGTERLDRSVVREYDNPRRAIEEALASLPTVASAEVTFFADKWRIELTPGPGGITHLSVRGVSADNGLTLSGPAYEPIEQGAETDLTPALRDPPPPAPEPTPDPAGQTSPAPGALVFEIGYNFFRFNASTYRMALIAYPDGHEGGGWPADNRADIDLAYLHANGEAVPYGGEVVRGALAVHRLYADPAGRIKAALEALPNVATAKVTLIGLDEPHPVHGYNKAWRIELTEGPGGVEKLETYYHPWDTGRVLTPIEGDARRATWAVDDNLEGGSGDDTMRGGSGDDTIDGAGGDDKLYGGEGNDELRGGDGDNRLSGGPGDDTLYGDGAGDELYGGPGDDTLYGGAGDDHELYGGPGDDKLYSGGGDALLSGGPGDDRLTGGGGADTFRFAPGHSSGDDGDVITDFDFGDGDRLMFIGISLDELTLSNRRDADGDGAFDDRIITLPDGGIITLLDVGNAVFALDNIII